MNPLRILRRAPLALVLLLVAASALAQAQAQAQKPKFEPTVGQEGKDVVWVPTHEAMVQQMLDLAKVTPSDFLIDLGSGDGRTVIAAAKRGARALGIEYNPNMVELARGKAAEAGVTDKAQFLQADLFDTDLSKATVVTMFLLPDINMKLRPRILDLHPGTRIVSNSFTMEDWEADESVQVEGGCESWCTALFWIVPAKVAGTWTFANGELTLTQQFQMLTGTLTMAGKTVPIAEGRMRGSLISFTAGGSTYSGTVTSGAMLGTVTTGATKTQWRATRVK